VTGPVSRIDPDALDKSGEIELGTNDIDLQEVMDMAETEAEADGDEIVGIDAFADGKPRPDHLDE